MKDVPEFIPDMCVFQMQLNKLQNQQKTLNISISANNAAEVSSTSMFKTLNIDSLT